MYVHSCACCVPGPLNFKVCLRVKTLQLGLGLSREFRCDG